MNARSTIQPGGCAAHFFGGTRYGVGRLQRQSPSLPPPKKAIDNEAIKAGLKPEQKHRNMILLEGANANQL